MENIELIARYQRPLGTTSLTKQIGWGLEYPSSPPTTMGRRLGGIHIKVIGYLEEKKGQGWPTVFSNDAVLICCFTRLRLEIVYQEEHRSKGPLRTVPPQL